MSSRVKVEVIGLNKAINNIESYVNRKRLALKSVVREQSADIASTAKQLAPIDLGDLKNKIKPYKVIGGKHKITGRIVSGARYSAFVEYGTRPHRPPAKALEGWAARHGVPVGAVLNKIAIKGTPAQPFMFPAAERQKQKFIRACRMVMSQP